MQMTGITSTSAVRYCYLSLARDQRIVMIKKRPVPSDVYEKLKEIFQ